MKKPTFAGAAVATVLVAAAVLAWGARGRPTRADTERRHALVERELKEVAELALLRVRYSDIATIKKRMLAARAYSIVRYTGTIRAGIADVSAAEITLSADGHCAEVVLPRCEILGNDITGQAVFDEQRSIFLPITAQEVFGEIDAARAEMEREMLEDGLLDECDGRARALVRRMLERLGFAEVTVVTRQESDALTGLSRAAERLTGR